MGDGEGSTREAHQAGRRTMNSVNEASSPYSLRDHSKMPSRYRDYVNTDEPLDGKPSPSKSKRFQSSHESSQEKTRHEISTHLPARRIARGRPAQADLTDSLKENLRRLKNVLKLPKARRWVYCEFFYSGVDQQLFLGDNEFTQLLRESFPNLRCTMLRRPEWRAIRRLIGKPRRCSQAFLNEERAALELKRFVLRDVITYEQEVCRRKLKVIAVFGLMVE
ncbi:unnamed protein product [Toxocara canis]|uniref:DIRP domain-containing protein n=1 Tax=Toxocara canis TaxID=6265 RepID=A0A183VG50_TOXCA|nr:unnamed protein product [Toxocara canis]